MNLAIVIAVIVGVVAIFVVQAVAHHKTVQAISQPGVTTADSASKPPKEQPK